MRLLLTETRPAPGSPGVLILTLSPLFTDLGKGARYFNLSAKAHPDLCAGSLWTVGEEDLAGRIWDLRSPDRPAVRAILREVWGLPPTRTE